MTTVTATVLPRRQPPRPQGQDEAKAVSTLPVLGAPTGKS